MCNCLFLTFVSSKSSESILKLYCYVNYISNGPVSSALKTMTHIGIFIMDLRCLIPFGILGHHRISIFLWDYSISLCCIFNDYLNIHCCYIFLCKSSFGQCFFFFKPIPNSCFATMYLSFLLPLGVLGCHRIHTFYVVLISKPLLCIHKYLEAFLL